MTYRNLKTEDVELFKIKTTDDEKKNIKNKTENHDRENILRAHRDDNEKYKKKYKSLNKKKILLIVSEILVGTSSTIGSSTMGLINP